jgi:iron complex outermembrane receptor protein
MTALLLLLALLAEDRGAKPVLHEAIVVSGIRAEEKTPVTKTDIDKATIEKDYYGQDIPLLLRDTPSINAYAEAGVGGSGYSYITLRGISPTRINFTLDGVPLADSEDMGTYFADFPDLAHSLESIQVQRGVGTSTVGSPSFGGSINLESIALSQSPETTAELGAGSYGTKFATVAYQSGFLPSGFALYTRVSAQQSDGFRESSGVRQRNVFVSAAKTFANSQLKLTGFTGHEYSQLAFFATDADTLKQNLRANPLTPSDKDSFGYDLAQLQYIRANMTASAYYQRGYGWYDLAGFRYGLDGLLLGGMLTSSASYGPVAANYGVHINQFRREHTRDTGVGAAAPGRTRDYTNEGTKGEANAFAKFRYDPARWHLYADAQLRTADFHYHGNVSVGSIRWTFFNPKIGARYDLSSSSGVYASVGMSTREPTRNDLFQGEDNASFAHDLRAVKPERLVDLEAGWDYRGRATTLKANVYAMHFRNEIAATGELSDIGLALRRNVDRSTRRGVELEAAWQAAPSLRLRGNANFSRNRIDQWLEFRDVKPLLTPEILLNQTIEYTPRRALTLGATGRYSGKSYLDNTNDERLITPSFFTLEVNAALDVNTHARVRVQVNNVLNNKRVWPNGYSFDGVPYYYPQATRNAVVMLEVR